MSTATLNPQGDSSGDRLSVRELRSHVADLFQIRPTIYWADLIFALTVGYLAAAVFIRAPLFSLTQAIALPIASVFIYRASLFMHEIVHFQKGEMLGFRIFWNLVAGIPMMTPSFFYETHLHHHNTRHYGTEEDGEYLPLANSGWLGLVKFLSQPFLLPVFTITRFAIMTPISFLHPRLRAWTLAHWSSFVIDLRYHRKPRPADPTRLWAAIELACFIRASLLFVLPIFVPAVPWYQCLLVYTIAVSVLMLNHFRTLVAHRYRSQGERMTHAEQLFDSVDITGDRFLTEAFCPVGLRYHALHHLFPGMPYHNLGIAHQRLMDKLPEDAPYRQCVSRSIFSALRQLICDVRSKNGILPASEVSCLNEHRPDDRESIDADPLGANERRLQATNGDSQSKFCKAFSACHRMTRNSRKTESASRSQAS